MEPIKSFGIVTIADVWVVVGPDTTQKPSGAVGPIYAIAYTPEEAEVLLALTEQRSGAYPH